MLLYHLRDRQDLVLTHQNRLHHTTLRQLARATAKSTERPRDENPKEHEARRMEEDVSSDEPQQARMLAQAMRLAKSRNRQRSTCLGAVREEVDRRAAAIRVSAS